MTSLTAFSNRTPGAGAKSVSDSSAQTKRIITISLAAAVVYQVVMLILVGVQNRFKLNSDAVCYIRIASYYVEGQLDLAVSGYWGPMLSWLIAPLLGLVESPLDAARIAMGASAGVFLFGCIAIFRSLDIHPVGLVLGTWIVAVATISWSVAQITPDLLMGGLMCMALSGMLSPRWTENRSTQLAAGTLWGAAYLSKAIAFPLAILMGSAIATLWVIGRGRERVVAFRSLMITLLAFLLVASPWIITLSLKYKSIVFSTSGKINHAIAGPEDVDRYHPGARIFHIPELGRITSGEDPTNMPYKYWSPFESWAYAKHQLNLIYKNCLAILDHLAGFDWLHVGVLATFFGLFVHTPWRQNMGVHRWRWAGVIIICLASVYLPVHALDRRYYYTAYPLLLSASIGMVTWMTPERRESLRWLRLLGFLIVGLCFGLNVRAALYGTNIKSKYDYQALNAYKLAGKLQAAGIKGPVAGGSREGLYVAFFTDQPWYGNELNPTAESFKRSRAKLAIITRIQPLINELDRDSAFVDLDSLLFDRQDEAYEFPLKVYRVASP